MRLYKFALLPLSVAALAACDRPEEQQADIVEDRVEQQAEQSAAASGAEQVALGMTEAQLIDADLVNATGDDLGDIEAVRRNAAGMVEGLLVKLDDTDPDRYVIVALDGLSTRADGDDMDVQTSMAAADLAAMPDAPLGTATSAPAM